MTVYFPETHTADEWRAKAKESRQRSYESFERSDTDGFLSQWASDSMARMYDALAAAVESGGKAKFTGIAALNGNLLDAREVKTKYGYSWRIWNPETRTVAWFRESTAQDPETAAKNNAKKGYQIVTFEADAVYVFSEGMMPSPRAIPREGAERVVVAEYKPVMS